MSDIIIVKKGNVPRRRQERKEAMENAKLYKIARRKGPTSIDRIMKSNRGVEGM